MINHRYEILSFLGSGRSKVYKCKDIILNRVCAIKILSNESDNYEELLFREEYIILQQLNHQNIVKSFDFGTIITLNKEDEKYGISFKQSFFTMEHFEGVPIDQLEVEDEEKLLNIIEKILQTLFYIHEAKYIYHDLKAENILVNKSEIKFIDFGLAETFDKNTENIVAPRGTDVYLAPELLGEKNYDKRIDFYSLGILLYKLIYGNYPFKFNSELELYKSKLEDDIIFPQCNYSEKITEALEKLLKKDPNDRYENEVQICYDLGLNISTLIENWKVPTIFVVNETVSEVKNFILEKNRNLILMLVGLKGSGKTAIGKEIYQNFQKVILVSNNTNVNNEAFWKTILRQMFFNKYLFEKLNVETKDQIFSLLFKKGEFTLDKLKSIFNIITKSRNFVLILDDFDKFDLFTQNFIESIAPYFVIRNCKLIITVEKRHEILKDEKQNIKYLYLAQYNKDQISKFVNKLFSQLFQSDEIIELVLEYSDLLPQSVVLFLQNLFDTKVFEAGKDGFLLNLSSSKLDTIKKTQLEILKQKLEGLNNIQLELLKILSAFTSSVNPKILQKLVDYNYSIINEEIQRMIQINLIEQIGTDVYINSVPLKSIVYESITNKEKIHLDIALKLCSTENVISFIECAKHYEKAKVFKKALFYYTKELDLARNTGAFNYEKNLLEYILTLPISQKEELNIKIRLSEILFILGEFKKTDSLLQRVINKIDNESEKLNLLFRKADCLVELGKIEEGIKEYNLLYKQVLSDKIKAKLEYSIAKAESYLGRYKSSEKRCKDILNNISADQETIANTHNLLGIIKFYLKKNTDEIINEFEHANDIYKRNNDYKNLIKTENNTGNILSASGELTLAKKHWDKAQHFINLTGNLDDEMRALLNYGVYYYKNDEFGEAETNYKEGLKIATAIGSAHERGLFLINLSELYLFLGKYEQAITAISDALQIFESLGDTYEMGEANYILCLTFKKLGDDNSFHNQLAQYELLLKNTEFVQTQNQYFEYLELLRFEESFNYNFLKAKIDALFSYEASKKDFNFFITLKFYFLNILIREKLYDEALFLIEEEDLFNKVKHKKYFLAELYFYVAILSEKSDRGKPDFSFDNYLTAYELLKDLELTELSWKTTFKLSEKYLERGNVNKALEFITLTEQILSYFKNQFSDVGLKNIFINQKERKETLIKIERWQKVLR